MALFRIPNGPSPTTAAQVAVTTGTAIKTMLQVKNIRAGRVVEWGIFFDGAAAGVAIPCELIETDVGATVTAHVEAGIIALAPAVGGTAADHFTLGTDDTGYTGSVEDTTTAARSLDYARVPPNGGGYVKQFPLGREPVVVATDWLRIRTTAVAAVNCVCYVVIEPG